MDNHVDLPIALRRTRRASSGRGTTAHAAQIGASDGLSSASPLAKTPNRRQKSQKRVRFSDPGPVLKSSTCDDLSTGLTPFIRRTSLGARPGRRHSTPSQSSARSASGSGVAYTDTYTNACEEVTFLPLRQVLDGRIKRRIRRNGLSEEMNTIQAERKRRSREAKEELDRLRAELAKKDDEIRQLQDETVIMDSERVWDLERQVESLKQQLADKSGTDASRFDWTIAARDPYSDDYMDMDTAEDVDVGVDEFGESSMADLVCSTPTRRARASFPTPPTTSPAAAPVTPCSRSHFATPRSHTGVQANLPDHQRQELEDELGSLRLELAKLTTTLESYTALTSRVSSKLTPFALSTSPSSPAHSSESSPHPEIEAHLTTLLQTLSDRTAALVELNSSVSDLGFPGDDTSSILASIRTAFRTARLELEYLTPGEISLPLTSSGAAVLDLLLERLRDLARRTKEADDSVDEYHALELSLRQQLSTRIDVTDGLRREVKVLQAAAGEKDARAAEQALGLDRLKGALASYTRDVKELEGLVQQLEGDLASADGLLAEKTGAVKEMEEKLVSQTAALEAQLADLRSTHAVALEDLRRAHRGRDDSRNREAGKALALRDARVAELRGEVDRVNGALRAAHETVQKLRVENAQVKTVNEVLKKENEGLVTDVEEERRKAKEVVDGMRAELERVVKMSEGLLATPRKVGRKASRRDSALGEEDEQDEGSVATTPSSSRRGSLLSGSLARNTRKRRRYDSGLGFLDEEEVDVDA